MSQDLYPYYERELLSMRQLAQDFQRQYPAAAGRLGIEASHMRLEAGQPPGIVCTQVCIACDEATADFELVRESMVVATGEDPLGAGDQVEGIVGVGLQRDVSECELDPRRQHIDSVRRGLSLGVDGLRRHGDWWTEVHQR